MTSLLIKFGDVFKYRDKDYVYLAKTDEVLYVAQILSQEHTKQLNHQSEKISKQPHRAQFMEKQPLYCFVILRTEDFRDRAAFLGRPEMDDDLVFDVYSQLECEDLKKIKDEIIRKDSPVSPKLKELISDIDV